MLEPNQRQHLLQALRPPEGYELSFAIGTTYSLDLMALLCVPLAFAQFDWEDDAGRPSADPLALLEALRRYADRIHVFCQAGGISVATKHQLLFSYLEQSVIQVQAPLGGVFHPKVWALRFTSPDEPVMYRLLCLSRNLTFDHSWDTLLSLEGEVRDRQKGYAAHRPLGDFINALPNLAYETVPEEVLNHIHIAEQELRRVDFYLPDRFDTYSFWPTGIPGYQHEWPFQGNFDRFLVVSPFITPECLHRFAEQGADHVLMSRLDSLSMLRRKDFAGFKQIFALNPMAEIEEPDSEKSEKLLLDTAQSGLHAKLYVADSGRKAHVWTGSANATTAAFHQNVEFLIEMTGPRSFCGVDVFLEKTQEQAKFADLWEAFSPSNDLAPVDPVEKELENLLRVAQTTLVSSRWRGHVSQGSSPDEYFLQVTAENECNLVPEIEALCWPLSLSSAAAVHIDNDALSIPFGPVAMESLTSFFVFQLTARVGNRSMLAEFVLHLPLEGAPADRPEHLLRAMLKNRDQVMRFLLFILAEGKGDIVASNMGLIDILTSEDPSSFLHQYRVDTPLFESLVQALYRDPIRLDQIARTVADLERTPEGAQLLPEGFHEVWSPIWEARQRMRP